MKNLFVNIRKLLCQAKGPASSINISGVGELVFDSDEDAWIGCVEHEFGCVKICLSGDWSTPCADGLTRPHAEAVEWIVEIKSHFGSFCEQVWDFIDQCSDLRERFNRYLKDRYRPVFDEIHIYKSGDKPIEALVSFMSEDEVVIWRVSFSNKKPVSFYSESPERL